MNETLFQRREAQRQATIVLATIAVTCILVFVISGLSTDLFALVLLGTIIFGIMYLDTTWQHRNQHLVSEPPSVADRI